MGNEILIIAVYVDDILVTGSSLSMIKEFKDKMNGNFDMLDLGKLKYYLGIEVEKGSGSIELKQMKRILEKVGMAECNSTKYPMDPNECLHKDEKGVAVDTTEFKNLVGGLCYLVHTRPDIAYAVGIVSRFMDETHSLAPECSEAYSSLYKGNSRLWIDLHKGHQE